jgi:spore photoproduct lyase
VRTPSAAVDPFLAAGAAPNVIVSWTFTPQAIVDAFEPGTASLDARIAAATRLQKAGFRIGLRFDPIILSRGWPDAYADLIARLAAALDPSLIESAHLGCLRFPPAFKAFAAARFGRGAPFDAEFALGVDGKLHYPRPLRAAAYVAVRRLLAAWDDRLKVRLVMETPSVEADVRRLCASKSLRSQD